MSILCASFRVCRFLPRLHHFLPVRTMSSESSDPRPIVMSGPSGSGKSTLLNKLFEEYPDSFAFSVSHTTRNPRQGEVDGKDYHFVNKENFLQMIEQNEFLEHAQFSGNCYGTSKRSVLDIQETGRICILDVEINGVKSIKKTDLNARYVFIQPPDMKILKARLENRGTETDESLKKRLDSAQEALDYANAGAYDYVIVNDVLDKAYGELKDIVKDDVK
ncbi:uncharacterized protein LOC132559441 [Ylistrum balloti]|uniref:uncharacterized protein LOC132559441 n=1 Tax=Ylistrum balloti TaxID=509963 RepID=UPI002905B13A|nr:uncharacterized protein LOC132559441 [Ylistrum balloti]